MFCGEVLNRWKEGENTRVIELTTASVGWTWETCQRTVEIGRKTPNTRGKELRLWVWASKARKKQ